MFLLLPASLSSELTEVTIATTLLAQDHSAPVKVEIGPQVWNPGTSRSRLSLRKYPPRHFSWFCCLGFSERVNVIEAKKKKKAAFNLSDSSKQHSREHWSSQSKTPVDKFGIAMRSRPGTHSFEKQYMYKNRLMQNQAMEITAGWPGDATSSDSWRFCIAWFSNCYGNEHHRMQNHAILLQCDRPLRPRVHKNKSMHYGLQVLRHSPATGVATGKIGSKQRQRPIQKHAGRSSIDWNSAPHLYDPHYLLKCNAQSREGVVKTVRTSLRRNKELRQVRDFSPSMLLYWALPLFRTNFPRCHALLSFLTSSLASPMGHWHGEISSNVTFAYCTKGCIDVAVLRGRPLTHVDAKPKFIYRSFSFLFLHEDSQRGCRKGKEGWFFKGRQTQSTMEASIARKRTRLGRGVLRHQLAQVCASSCIMTCFSCAVMVFRYSKRARTFFT